MKKNTLKKVVVGASLIVSMVGTNVVSAFADSDVVVPKGVSKADALVLDDLSTVSGIDGYKAYEELEEKEVLDRIITTKSKKAKSDYIKIYDYLLWKSVDRKDLDLTRKEYKAIAKYLQVRAENASYTYTGIDSNKLPKIDAKLKKTMYAKLDALKAIDLLIQMDVQEEYKEFKKFGDYAEKLRATRVHNNNTNEVTGLYLELASINESAKQENVEKVKFHTDKAIDSVMSLDMGECYDEINEHATKFFARNK